MFGTSAAALRSLPAVFGVVVLLCVYWLAGAVCVAANAAIAVALVAVSPFYVLYAQEAREYSLWTLAIAAAGILVLARRRAAPARGRGPPMPSSSHVGLYVYPLTGLVAVGFFVYVLIAERLRITRAVVSCFVASLCALIAFAPWLTVMRASRGLGQGMATIMRAKLTPGAFAFILARDLRFPYFDFGAFRLGPLGSTAINAALTAFCVVLSATPWSRSSAAARSRCGDSSSSDCACR